MPTPAEIAAKYGGVPVQPDAAAVAAKYGGVPVEPTYRTETKASEQPDWMQRAANATEDFAADLLTGFVKGGASTAVNLGELAQHTPLLGRVLIAANRKLFGLSPEQQHAAFDAARAAVAPTTTTQKVGKGLEQLAEVVAPGAAIERAGASAVAKAAPLLQRALPATAARIVPRAVVEGAANAAMAKAQGGSAIAGGIMGAALPAAGELADAAASSLRTAASKQVMQALGPTKERFKAVAERLTPEILKRGLRGSRESLVAQAADALEQSGDAMDALLTTVGTQPVSVRPVVTALETAKDAFRTSKTMSVSEALSKGYVTLKNGAVAQAGNVRPLPNGMVEVLVELEPRTIRQLNQLQKVIEDLGPVSSVDQLRAVRQTWDKVVAQAGGYAQRAPGAIGMPLKDQSEAFVKREGANAIRKLLADEVPDLAAINKEYSFWKGLDEVVSQTLKRTEPQRQPIGRQIAEGVGAAAASSHGLGSAFGIAKLAGFANRAFTSPRWRLMSAQYKHDLAEAIVSGEAGKVASLLGRVTAVEGSKLVPTTSSAAR